MDLAGRRILLGVTGGIAAYKAAEFVRLLTAEGAEVQVIMTEAATRFVGTVTFQALSGRPVHTDQWDARIDNNMAHIELSRHADLIVVAPASADFIAKTVHGLADDLLSTLCLARDCPLLLAPAMNRQMWEHPATQRNVRQLEADGVALLGPAAGDQACGEVGMGRMLEANELLADLVAFLQPKVMAERRVLVTAGPTYEPIDPVRGITNRSSGKMGFAVARAFREAGAEVTLVAGPVALETPRGVRRVDVVDARQMYDAVMAEATGCDVLVSVAAVADWRVRSPSSSKIKKESGRSPELAFEENPDILASVARLETAPYCVGFAAESDALEANAQAKRKRKGVPLLFGNIGHQAFGRDDNELVLVDEHGIERLPASDKRTLARRLVTEVARRLGQR
ncbi:MAG: bifunctional phosphopantothenoylcysteine decarboxylase/phosphopantothenate--cysteine ligase CoaBC [Burkholderiales bacterium]|nr:MAG: bifunctional phosphopantothenoylcysteine decarboxylase/phosphopantothenate--cysteine ligase CoaBC [Burkholderiales bacterium]